jgi:hypothetical protein
LSYQKSLAEFVKFGRAKHKRIRAIFSSTFVTQDLTYGHFYFYLDGHEHWIGLHGIH